MSSGSAARLASSTMKAKGVHCQVWMTITETRASVGSPSQFWLPSPAVIDSLVGLGLVERAAARRPCRPLDGTA